MKKSSMAGAALFALVFSVGAMLSTGSANAADTAVKACADQWAQMKKDNKIPAGQKWSDFEKTCVAQQTAAPATPAAKPVTPAVTPAAPAKPATPVVAAKPATTTAPAAPAMPVAATGGKAGEQSRIKNCSGQWEKMKAAKAIPAGLTWPAFWHDCDTKLKAAGQ